MFIERNPVKIAEKLHRTTLIPCSAYTRDGKILYCAGSHFQHGDYEVYNRLLETMTGPAQYRALKTTLTGPGNHWYTACFISRSHLEDGFVLLGPYTREDLDPLLPFDHCWYSNLTPDPSCTGARSCPAAGCSGCYSPSVRQAIHHIQTHYAQSITLQETASRLKLNKSYFCTLFRQETGLSFTAYVNRLRIEKSRPCLLDARRSVLDIALSVGFSSQNYYSVQFKKYMHLTPLEYRRKAFRTGMAPSALTAGM